jgi:uncharacterized protein (DUF111 family)
MTVQQIGVGAGSQDLAPLPNILRVFIGESAAAGAEGDGLLADAVVMVAANVDDMAPELFESALQAAFAAGALDVWLEPIYMKHNRPAVQVNALAAPGQAAAVAEALLRHTTTLGVRLSHAQRLCLPREMVQVATPFGEIAVKIGRLAGRVVTAQPEYRECVDAAHRWGVAVREVYAAAQAAAYQLLRASPGPSAGGPGPGVARWSSAGGFTG